MKYYEKYNTEQLKDIIRGYEDTHNIIMDDREDTIGYYNDLDKMYKKLIKEAVQDKDYERAGDLMDELEEMDEYSDYDGLLRLSMNNGMGFTCKPYCDDYEVAEWVMNNVAPTCAQDIPRIYNEKDRQDAFVKQVIEMMRSK